MQLFPPETAATFRRDGWWSGRTWTDLLAEHRRVRPDELSLVDADNRADFMVGPCRRLTWSQVGHEVDQVAQVLYDHGVRQDDVVALQLPNCVELPIALLAITRIGAICTPFPVQYGRHELAGMGARAGIVAFVTATDALRRQPVQTAVELRDDDVPSLATVLAFGDRPGAGYELIDATRSSAGMSAEFEAYLAGLQVDDNDCATLVWTSGTEGTPKGVPRAFGDWEVLGTACSEPAGLSAQDVLLNPFPMVNGGGLAGMFLPWITLGATLVQHQPFELDLFVRQIEQEAVTYTCAPPPVLEALVADGGAFDRRDLSTLRAVSSGSAPLPGWMISRWEDGRGVEVLNLFGSNEGGILFADPDTVPEAGRRGRLFPRYGVEGMPYRHRVARAMSARLVDLETGAEITEPGQAGELRLKGPTVLSGYWGMGRHGFDADGWFCTGDVFEYSTEDPAYLVHVDRAKDLIIRGGYKISAAEIEGLVGADPRVREVAAVAMPDPRLGEKLCLFIVPHEVGSPPALDDLIALLADSGVAKFKWPERLEIVESLPRNAIGKILKRQLRGLFEPAAHADR